MPDGRLSGAPPRGRVRARPACDLRGLRRDLREDLPPLTARGGTTPTTESGEFAAGAGFAGGHIDLAASRRRLQLDGLGIIASAGGFGFVYGLAARAAGFSPLEATGMSVLVFAGAAQFAAVGYVLGGFSWLGIVLLTAFLNARHFLYAAALAPYLADRPRPLRAFLAHLLTDEAFALSIAHFRRIGRADLWGYWWAAIVTTFIPWNVATILGSAVGGNIPDPGRFGLDVIFPAAMGGLAVGLMTGRREIVAALVGAVTAVGVGLAWDPAAGILAGGLLGPAVGMITPPARRDRPHEAVIVFTPTMDDPSARSGRE
ncbi:MAG: AzlC family ABC transporter permease [Chloroflexi bacterium]|nr:AzlC family ABC transporter permease [Chloroflexota bacterium]